MAFCSNCGKQLEGTGHFCVHCGADNAPGSVNGTTATMAAPAAAVAAVAPPPPTAPPMAAAQPFQPMAAPPYAPQGAVPMPVVFPPQPAPQKKGGVLGTLVVLAILAGGGYYYYNQSHPPTPAPSTSSQNQALVKQQAFAAQWQAVNGFLVLTTAKWTNNSTVPLASATIQCEQFDAGGTDLSQYRVSLTGPTAPSTVSSYSNIQMGAIANGMAKVSCDIVHVKTSQ